MGILYTAAEDAIGVMIPSPVVVVTGASKGIGLAVTEILLTKFKARVVSLSRSRPPALDKLSQEHPSTLQVIECDITDEVATTSALIAANDKYGRLDGLILNAGVMSFGRIDKVVDDWKQVFDVNFFSLLHTVRAALPGLRKSKGNIVFVSSGAAVGGTTGWGAYNASKAAVNSLCRTLANEEPDITCVALRPGMVDTGMQEKLRSEGAPHMLPNDMKRFTEAHSMGKLVKPADAGHVIAALALKAPKDLSGKFVSWDAPELENYRAA